MTTSTTREATNKPMLVTKLDSPLCTRLSSVSMSAVIRDSSRPELSVSKKASGWAKQVGENPSAEVVEERLPDP